LKQRREPNRKENTKPRDGCHVGQSQDQQLPIVFSEWEALGRGLPSAMWLLPFCAQRKCSWKRTFTHRLHVDVFTLGNFCLIDHNQHASLVVYFRWDGWEWLRWNGAVYSISQTDRIMLWYINSLAKSNPDDYW
jgi:hypothetical protein